jgi:hypothetical protein
MISRRQAFAVNRRIDRKARSDEEGVVTRFNTDHDSIVDIADAKKADLFDKLDTDQGRHAQHQGTAQPINNVSKPPIRTVAAR